MHFSTLLATAYAFTAVSGHFMKRQVEDGLIPLLSSGASIYYPTDSGFTVSSERFTELNRPDFQLVVHVASEDDVVATVQFATANNITFLAKSGGHGLSTTLSRVRNSIMIDMRGLNYARYDNATSQVTVGGGITTGEMINATHAVGKEITAGSCPCTGVLGVTMGGGVGRLMGRHGLIIDNLVELRYVLANGTAITLNNQTDPELWWGARGAGQNFGIATSATYQVYDQVNDGMHYTVDMEFSMSQLQDTLKVINAQAAPLNENLALFYVTVPVGSTGGPVIAVNFVYSGPQADAEGLLQDWLDINPISFSDRVVSWDSLPWRVQAGLNSELCTPNKYRNSYSLAMDTYSPEGIQRLFDNWEKFVELYGANVTMNFIFETFPQQGVEAVDVDSTAYRWRGQSKHFGIFQATYTDGRFSTLVDDWLMEQEKIFNNYTGYGEKHVYLNYGKGTYNTLEDSWGYEGQVQRLTQLKRRVDPEGRFDGFRQLLDYA
ncbi:uncharacterized protein H6S33_011718 [Morchella sextelata]|uniref:uncharacterized protein n=1 Tax=Morchella sextelata TaxID=1174677 RepID=UPI001D03DFDA|nr:uncharacterized protein H6S33_011718 [Morchella sextelata]KAH0610191.1 hypothetical protein H6S33_011718 [Morchella sextelata]